MQITSGSDIQLGESLRQAQIHVTGTGSGGSSLGSGCSHVAPFPTPIWKVKETVECPQSQLQWRTSQRPHGLWGEFTGTYLVEGPGGLGKQGGFQGTATGAPWQIPAWSGAGEDNLGSLSVKGGCAGALAWDSGPWGCGWLPVTRGPPLSPSILPCKLQG